MRKIRWGVLGTAYIFERDTAKGMALADNCEIVAIAGRSLEKAEAFSRKYNIPRAYGNYEQLLEDQEIEAVYIPLPNTMHYEWTIRALKAGKHVLCEKPLAPTARQAEEMFKTARENHVLLMEAFAYQHSPLVSAVCQDVKSGIIGDIRYMESALITSDYDHSNIRMRKETLGGATYDVGVYAMSLLQRVMGTRPARVHAVSSMNSEGIDMYTAGVFEYESGAKANFDCGMVLATEKNRSLDRFQIHGTLGSIESVKFAFNMPGKLSYCVKTFDGQNELKTVDCPNNYCLEIEQFGRCVEGAEKPLVTSEFSISLASTVEDVLREIGYL